MEIPEQIWLLVARNLSGEASEAEQQELADILQKDEQLQQHYDLLTRVWIEKHGSPQQDDGTLAKTTVSRIISKASETSGEQVTLLTTRRRKISRKYWMAAASVLIIISTGFFWLRKGSSQVPIAEAKHDMLEAQKGSRTRAVLPDGSTVFLNAGSKLYYENDFRGNTREVRLDGEAFFDIVKKTDKPFIVHTSGIDIKVLGTAFNVKSYPEDTTVETTLYRGSVRVFRHSETEQKATLMEPNQKLTILKEAATAVKNLSDKTNTLSASKANTTSPTIAHIDSTKKENERIETAWVYNRLEIRGEYLEEIARKLERWYNIKIVFTDERVKELSFTATFQGETVDQVFASLKVANPLLTYKINNDEIAVSMTK